MVDPAVVVWRATIGILLCAACALPCAAEARVQEYQVIRLLSYKSECQLVTLENRSLATGPMIFFATCENVSFYPNGVEVRCADRDDDRSCAILTSEKRFDSLELLRQDPRR